MRTRKPRTNGAERAFQIIECLVALDKPATAYQVAKTLQAPLSTVYESIALLERLEVLVSKGGDGKYSPGPRLQVYGLAYSRNLEADEVYRAEAHNLARNTGYDCHICIRDGDYLVVSIKVEGEDRFHVSTRPGARLPLHWTASGRLLVGHLSPEERRLIIDRLAASDTKRVVKDPVQLEKICVDSWRQGYSIQLAESDFALACVAAPIINPDNACVATIGIVVPDSMADAKGAELAAIVVNSARHIEKQLGWRGMSMARDRRGVDAS